MLCPSTGAHSGNTGRCFGSFTFHPSTCRVIRRILAGEQRALESSDFQLKILPLKNVGFELSGQFATSLNPGETPEANLDKARAGMRKRASLDTLPLSMSLAFRTTACFALWAQESLSPPGSVPVGRTAACIQIPKPHVGRGVSVCGAPSSLQTNHG